MNNPLIFVDPDGKDVILYNAKGEKVATITKSGTVIEKGMETQRILSAYTASKVYLSKAGTTIFKEFENNSKQLEIKELIFSKNNKFNGDGVTELKMKDEVFESVKFKETSKLGEILWNPSYLLEDSQGNMHSPAMVLFHELSHAKHFKDDKHQNIKDAVTIDKQYDTAEERKNIPEVNDFAKKLNQVYSEKDGGDGVKFKRLDHGGKYHRAKHVTSNKRK